MKDPGTAGVMVVMAHTADMPAYTCTCYTCTHAIYGHHVQVMCTSVNDDRISKEPRPWTTCMATVHYV